MMRLAALSLAVLAACGAQRPATDRPGSALLRHIPSDTPYLMAVLEPTPRPELEHYLAKQRQSFHASRLSWSEQHGGQETRIIKAIFDELEPNLSPEGLDRLGFGAGATMAVYGLGLLPALRIEIKDPRAVEAFVGRLAAAAGGPGATSDRHGKRWEITQDGATFVIAVTETELLAGVTPTDGLEWFRDRLYDDASPGPTLADSGKVEELRARYRLSLRFVGWLDVADAMTAAVTPGSLIQKQLDGMKHHGDALTPECARETTAFFANVPRAIIGATDLGTAHQRVMVMVELEPTLAHDLAAVKVSAVGVGAPLGNAIASFGVAADVPKLIDILQARARRHLREPYRCKQLQPLNEVASQLDTELAQPIPPWVRDLRGVAFELGSIEPGAVTPKIRGAAVVSATDPIRLIDLAKKFLPQLPSINPQPDGKPVKVPGGIFFIDAYVAMKGQLFGVGIGDGSDAELVRLMAEPPLSSKPLGAFAAELEKLKAATEQFRKGDEHKTPFPTQDVTGKISVTISPEERGLRFDFVHEDKPEAGR